jgi:hypothetical protein
MFYLPMQVMAKIVLDYNPTIYKAPTIIHLSILPIDISGAFLYIFLLIIN